MEGTEYYKLVSQKSKYDQEKLKQHKSQLTLMLEQNKASITPSEKLSLMIQTNNSKKCLNSEK